MIRSTITVALVALTAIAAVPTAAAAATKRVPVAATWQPDTKRFCVKPASPEEAEAMQVDARDRTCLSQRMWRIRGVVFTQPLARTDLARL